MKGFTLIELMIAFAITSIIASVSMTSFTSYNQSQVFDTAASDFTNLVKIARSQAISQVKPPACGINPLAGYKIAVSISGQDYEEDAICGASNIIVEKKKLPQQLVFDSTSASSMFFDVSTGTVNSPGNFVVKGYGKTRTIAVDKIGNVSVGSLASASNSTPVPTQSTAPTPTPASSTSGTCDTIAKAYRLYSGYCVYVAPGYGDYCNSTCTDPAPTSTPTPIPITTPTPTTAVATVPTPTPTPIPSSTCSKDYYYSPPYCVYVGGNRGQYCDSSCSGNVATTTPTSAPISTPTPTAIPVVPTSTPIPAAPTPTPVPVSCSKDYYYSPPYCVYVGSNAGQYCDSTCGSQGTAVGATPTPTQAPQNFAPASTNATISSSTVSANGTSQYTITITGNDSNGGNDIGVEYALINYQGANAGSYRGFIGWSTTGNFPNWSAFKSGTPIACTGSGQAAINNDSSGVWGSQYINLISCSAPVVSGTTRVVSIVVTFNSSFLSPTTNNTISAFVQDWEGFNDNPTWKPYGLFNLTSAATPTPTPTSSASCVKNYYYSPPYCVYVGGGHGQYCDASCTF